MTIILTFTALPVSPAEAVPAKHTVVSKWKNANGTTIKLRLGTYSAQNGRGFGWAKIKTRHGIKKYSTVQHPTRSPYGAVWKGNPRTKAEYSAWAVEWKRVGRKWMAVAQRQVITVVEFMHVNEYYGVKMKTEPGVLTTYYCKNPRNGRKCPAWVDTAFLPANNRTSQFNRSAAPSGSTAYPASFLPIRLGQLASR